MIRKSRKYIKSIVRFSPMICLWLFSSGVSHVIRRALLFLVNFVVEHIWWDYLRLKKRFNTGESWFNGGEIRTSHYHRFQFQKFTNSALLVVHYWCTRGPISTKNSSFWTIFCQKTKEKIQMKVKIFLFKSKMKIWISTLRFFWFRIVKRCCYATATWTKVTFELDLGFKASPKNNFNIF